MHKDGIVEEVWRIKESHAAQYGYNIRAMARALRRAQRRGGRKVVSLSPKRPATTAAK